MVWLPEILKSRKPAFELIEDKILASQWLKIEMNRNK